VLAHVMISGWTTIRTETHTDTRVTAQCLANVPLNRRRREQIDTVCRRRRCSSMRLRTMLFATAASLSSSVDDKRLSSSTATDHC